MARLNGCLKAKLDAEKIAASESFVLSQAYFYGWVMNKPDLDHRVEVMEGGFIDQRDDLGQYEASGARSDNVTAGQIGDADDCPFVQYGDEQHREAGRLRDADMLALLSKHPNGAGDGWHNDMLAVTHELLCRGHEPFAIQMIVGSACRKGWSDPDIGKLIDRKWGDFQAARREAEREERAAKAAQKQVDPVDLWGKFELPTLPRGLLPDILEGFAQDQGTDMGADISGIAMSALAVCAAAIPDNIKLQVKRHSKGWCEAARLWVALVGPVSAKKTPIMAAAARPLRKIDAGQGAIMQPGVPNMNDYRRIRSSR